MKRIDRFGASGALVSPAWGWPTVVAVSGAERFAAFSGDAVGVVRTDWAPHVAALAGIVALLLLGGGLMLRNRISEFESENKADAPPDEDFLSDRERIHHLVNANGGRMKQSEIVDAVDWSKAKVSRLLADLEEDGEITKLRLGRENLICLQGNEPTASKSSDGSRTEP